MTVTNTGHIFPKETGMIKTQKEDVFIDFIKLSFDEVKDFAYYFENFEYDFLVYGLTIGSKITSLPKGYNIGYRIVSERNKKTVVGKVLYSSRYRRILYELTGKGCAHFAQDDPSYSYFQALLLEDIANIRRIDITKDDVEGYYNIEKVDKDFSRGRFNSLSNQRPKKKNIGCKKDGRTRNIGGNTSYKRLCIYEKGLSEYAGFAEYENWVRHELRLFANHRDRIPKDVMANLADYFYSAYPRAMKKLVGKLELLPLVDRLAMDYQRALGKRVNNCKYAYGPTINELSKQCSNDAIVKILAREGQLKGIEKPDFLKFEDIERHKLVLFKSID